jgi:hypothetical protein
MNLNEMLDKLLKSNSIDLDYINFYIKEKNNKTLSESDQKRFMTVLKDKLFQLNIPFTKEIINNINNDYSSYSHIDDIQSIEEDYAVLITGQDKDGYNKHNLISNQYNDVHSYDAYMHDEMFYENPNDGFGDVSEETMAIYDSSKNEIYSKFAVLVNKAFSLANKNVEVEGSDGYYGILNIIEGSGNLYIKGPTNIESIVESERDSKLFDIIYIEDNNKPLKISMQIKNGEFIVEEQTTFKNLLIQHSKKNELYGWKKEAIECYEKRLDELRNRPFNLELLREFIWHISMPPYISQEKYHFQRPLDIATEKLIQLVGISYEEANGYIEELNKNIRAYACDFQVGMDYSDLMPTLNIDQYLREKKQTKILTLLHKDNKIK